MTTIPPPVRMRALGDLAWAAVLAAVAAAAWFGWLGWDEEYWYDAAGDAHGPYETWQVVGCGLTLLAGAVVGALAWRPFGPLAAMPVAFTTAWIITSAPGDDQGLWPVGAIMVLIGTALGAVLVGAVATAIAGTAKAPSRAGLFGF